MMQYKEFEGRPARRSYRLRVHGAAASAVVLLGPSGAEALSLVA